MEKVPGRATMTRRSLLKKSVTVSTAFAVGAHWVTAGDAAWALEVTHLKPGTMATLIQMARDVYPHDHVADEFYAIAMKGYDSEDARADMEAGVAALDAAARGRGYAGYLDVAWERERVDILRGLEDSDFFQTIRGGLVTGLYNQKAVWPLFGYEGESYSRGGYIDHGFNDINWI